MNLVAGLSHPLFAWSGGNPTVQRQISGADLTDVGQGQANGPGGYHRDNRTNAKGSEHTLYADTVALYTLAPRRPGRRRRRCSPSAPTASRRPSATPPPASSCTWRARRRSTCGTPRPRRGCASENGTPHVDHDGVQIAPANVVIQFVSYVGVPGVGQSQQAVTVGEGEAWILTDGKIVKGTWSRPDPKQPAVYKDAAGNAREAHAGAHVGGAAPAGPGRRDPRRRRPRVGPYP